MGHTRIGDKRGRAEGGRYGNGMEKRSEAKRGVGIGEGGERGEEQSRLAVSVELGSVSVIGLRFQ